jgi:hypothetical protein
LEQHQGFSDFYSQFLGVIVASLTLFFAKNLPKTVNLRAFPRKRLS